MKNAATATYKGHSYRLLWSGRTKYGHRAKLGFRDGSRSFWVAASLISTSDDSTPHVRFRTGCMGCGAPATHHASLGPTCFDCYDDYSG